MEEQKFYNDKILAYAKFYDYMLSHEIEKETKILERVKYVNNTEALFDLLLKDECILWWKGALRIKRFFGNEYWTSDKKDELLKQLNEACDDSSINKNIVKTIGNGNYKGISFPIASTLVYFFSQRNCPIIDKRALQTLKEYGYEIRNDDWDKYFDVCKKIIDDCHISFRELDKALWIYPDVCQKEKNYLHICKKLNDLKIAIHPALNVP
ncbi:MAG: hypothetical protein A2W22_01885 [Candidatus Levybacteria bacterium RBG_16_35_11]|nr:MAG: hypothetical protein A2W22_01885 [Candidatus Levybacteria bacterium RBG_16_35_11]